MKILFINGSDIKGGAAIAATRLRRELSSLPEVECSAIVAYKHTDDVSVRRCRNSTEQAVENLIDRVTSLVGLQYQFFPFSSRKIIKHLADFKPDIVSLHNTHGGYFETALIKRISLTAPIVWTLHDMWSFTGNAAHTFGNEDWKSLEHSNDLIGIPPEIGINTGRWLLQQKRRLYTNARLSIITPSRWLYNMVKQAPVFDGKSIHHIPNGIDLMQYAPIAKETIRARLNIPLKEMVIAFSADFLRGNIWKGGNDLVQVLRRVNSSLTSSVHLIIIGDGVLDELQSLEHFNLHFVGYVKEEKLIAAYLGAADILVYPTRADNLPNVLVESIACGTPCITFNIGGCAEIIRDGFNGRVVESGDLEEMASAVLQLIHDPDRLQRFSVNARRYAEENFSVTKMAGEYHDLYVRIIQGENSIKQ